jgi:hypothetical protein
MHRELQALFEQDKTDRAGLAHLDQDQRQPMLQRAKARRQRVETLLASAPLLDAEDYFHAAMNFLHGETPEHFLTGSHSRLQRGQTGAFRLFPSDGCRLRPRTDVPGTPAKVRHPVHHPPRTLDSLRSRPSNHRRPARPMEHPSPGPIPPKSRRNESNPMLRHNLDMHCGRSGAIHHLLVVIVRAGVEWMRGRDPCGRPGPSPRLFFRRSLLHLRQPVPRL